MKFLTVLLGFSIYIGLPLVHCTSASATSLSWQLSKRTHYQSGHRFWRTQRATDLEQARKICENFSRSGVRGFKLPSVEQHEGLSQASIILNGIESYDPSLDQDRDLTHLSPNRSLKRRDQDHNTKGLAKLFVTDSYLWTEDGFSHISQIQDRTKVPTTLETHDQLIQFDELAQDTLSAFKAMPKVSQSGRTIEGARTIELLKLLGDPGVYGVFGRMPKLTLKQSEHKSEESDDLFEGAMVYCAKIEDFFEMYTPDDFKLTTPLSTPDMTPEQSPAIAPQGSLLQSNSLTALPAQSSVEQSSVGQYLSPQLRAQTQDLNLGDGVNTDDNTSSSFINIVPRNVAARQYGFHQSIDSRNIAPYIANQQYDYHPSVNFSRNSQPRYPGRLGSLGDFDEFEKDPQIKQQEQMQSINSSYVLDAFEREFYQAPKR